MYLFFFMKVIFSLVFIVIVYLYEYQLKIYRYKRMLYLKGNEIIQIV